MTKPTVDVVMKRKVSGHSRGHLKWELAKKEAKQKGADVSKLPKEDLGPLLDQFHQYVMGAGEVARYYPTLDNRTLKPLRETKSKIRTQKYWDVCDAQLQLRDAELTRQGGRPTLPSDGKTPWGRRERGSVTMQKSRRHFLIMNWWSSTRNYAPTSIRRSS